MSSLWTIFRRELAAYFNAAIAYIFIIVFVVINAGLFMTQFFLINRAEMRSFFLTLPFLLAVFLPAVTMRLWAEEKRGNTLELLLTFPMSTQSLVLGKFLASFVFYLAALAATLPLPVMLHVLGRPDTGAIAGGYLGTALLGAFYLAVGIFVSGLVRDQIVAFILAMMACFALHLMGMDFLATSMDGWLPGLGTFLKEHVGSAGHFEAFSKGVLDTGDVLYFMIGTVMFLVLNGFWLEGRMRPRARTIFSTAVVIGGGIFLMSNWLLSGLPLGRFDMTQARLYTVSPATIQIFKSLKAPVTAKLYISPADKMPSGMKTLEQDVVGKLEEFKVASGGLFQYKIYHMDTENVTAPQQAEAGKQTLEEQVSAKGVQPFQVQSIDADELGVKLVYSTLSLAYKEKPEEIIPQIMPENLFNLEYSIASRVFRMTLSEKPKIAMVAPYQDQEMDPNMAALLAQIGGGKVPSRYRQDDYQILNAVLDNEGYEVSRVSLSQEEPLPEGIRTLVLLEPQQLTERQRYEINRFLVQGGSLFLAAQNYEFQYDPSGGRLSIQGRKKNPEVNPLLEPWGFQISPDILADEQNEVISISGGAQMGPFAVSVPVKTPIQALVTSAQMNPDLSITSRLDPMFYLWGSVLKIDDARVKKQNLNVQTLFESSQASWTVPFVEVLGGRDLAPDRATAQGPFPLAVYAQGAFTDGFAGKTIPAWPKPEEEVPADPAAPPQPPAKEEPAPALASKPGKLILVGNSIMFHKNLVQGGGHLAFFMNAVDILTLGEELVRIRAKQPVDPTIRRISPAQKILWRSLVTLLTPLGLAAVGGLRMFWRAQEKQRYLKTLAALNL